jgi:hypothetical protein
MKGYKAFNPDFACRDYQFSENSEHKINGKAILCSRGFHFCTEMAYCFKYYPLCKDTIICEVEALGDAVSEFDDSKYVTNHIKILNRIELDLDELLIEYSKHNDWYVRYEVAKNLNTSIETVTKLSDDEDWGVRLGVAKNPYTSSETLTKLSNDKDYYVRRAAANNLKRKKYKKINLVYSN